MVEGSPAINAGVTVAGHALDFANRTAPDPGGVTDIGAFEYGSSVGSPVPDIPDLPADSGNGSKASGTSGSDDTDDGCSCSSVGAAPSEGSSLGGLAWLLGAVWLGRRRSRLRE